MLIIFHIALAILLFALINWIGRHAEDFGYSNTTLLEDTTESLALNFVVRSIFPAIFITIISAILIAIGKDNWRIGIYSVSIWYFAIRFFVVFAYNRQILISWPRFFIHVFFGIGLAYSAYVYLIIPKNALFPDLETAGNEVWLAIIAFLYAISNKVQVSDSVGSSRRNRYIRSRYRFLGKKFGGIIDQKIDEPLLKLAAYSIIIFEDYSRPMPLRFLEKLLLWKKPKSTGIMQFSSRDNLTDEESVSLGLEKLVTQWNKLSQEDIGTMVWDTITNYNPDTDYAYNIEEVMRIIALRIDPRFKNAYRRAYPIY